MTTHAPTPLPIAKLSPQAAYTLHELRELYGKKAPHVSFEFFPPKSDDAEAKLWDVIGTLAPLKPRFVSVTYGAGGTTRERTHATVTRIVRETNLTAAAHLTCINASKAEIEEIAHTYWTAGVRHIVALRGDAPAGSTAAASTGDYHYADDLVKGLKSLHDFDISVAAYPETHPEARSAQDDLDHLKRKFDAGANRAITQFFFDVDLYLNFVEKARANGITQEIVPGILPVTNVAQLKKFAGMCGTRVPSWMDHLLEGLDSNPALLHSIAAMVAAEQCRMLMLAGVEHFHFYTLNRAELTQAICHILGVRK